MRQALLASMFVGMSLGVQAQKFAYIDSEYVLLHMPERRGTDGVEQFGHRLAGRVKTSWKRRTVLRWRTVLSACSRRQRCASSGRRRSSRSAQRRKTCKQKFGVDGELFTKRQELIEPVQQQIFESLKDIASGSGYMVIFDKSNQSNITPIPNTTSPIV